MFPVNRFPHLVSPILQTCPHPPASSALIKLMISVRIPIYSHKLDVYLVVKLHVSSTLGGTVLTKRPNKTTDKCSAEVENENTIPAEARQKMEQTISMQNERNGFINISS